MVHCLCRTGAACRRGINIVEVKDMNDRNNRNDWIDLHTHTLASGHAYSTIDAMAEAGRKQGLRILGITEHAPKMPGTCSELYFSNLRVLQRERQDITVLFGAELNIMDSDGNVDLPERLLRKMDLCIASMHMPCYAPGTIEENTRAYLKVMENPYVNIIGHPDDGAYPVDYRALVEGAKEQHVLLEVNNGSLSPGGFRWNVRENYHVLLGLCKEYGVPVILDSDAHVDTAVGAHSYAWEVIRENDFPEELVINTQLERLREYLNYYTKGNGAT